MHPTTQKLFDKLVDPNLTLAGKVQLLHGAYRGDTAFILACGPSLAEYQPMALEELLGGKLVLCIKQALDFVPTQGDYLLLNSWNFRRYDFSKGRPVVVRESGSSDPPVFHEGDLHFDIPKPSDRSEQLALSRKFDAYTLERQLNRPWGPGVLYEIGFYLAQHMGCSKIVTLGWDVGVKNSPQMPHFYDTTSAKVVSIIRQSREIESLEARNKFLHDNFVTYNRPRIIPEEVDDCAAVSQDWADWLHSKGIELKVVSKNSLASQRISRTRIENEV